MHLVTAPAARHHRGGLGLVHLRPRLARRVPRPDRGPAPGRGPRPTGAPPTPGGAAELPKRRHPVPWPVPGPGDTVEIHAAYESQAVRIEFFGDTVERIRPFDVLTGEIGDDLEELVVFANTHYGTGDERMRRAVESIEAELRQRLPELTDAGKLLEAQRLRMRTEYDLEMLAETGVCSGVELQPAPRRAVGGGGAVHLARLLPEGLPRGVGREPCGGPPAAGSVRRGPFTQRDPGRPRVPAALGHGQPPPAIRGVHRAHRTGHPPLGHPRALGTRTQRQRRRAGNPAHGAGRPRGGHRADHWPDRQPARRIDKTVAGGHRVLVTTLTKKMAEDLTDYLAEQGVRVQYLHSDVDTMARIEILRELRLGAFDVLVGINLLHRGLGPARSGAGGHPRRRQGGVPPFGFVPHPDHGPGGQERERTGGHVRRHHHRLHDHGHRGDPAEASPPDRLQPSPRDRSPHHHQVGHRHPGAGAWRRRGISRHHLGSQRGSQQRAQRSDPWRPQHGRPPRRGRRDGPGTRTRCRRAVQSDPPARPRDEQGGRRAAVRRGRPPPRRGGRTAGPARPGSRRRDSGPGGRDRRRRRGCELLTGHPTLSHRYPHPMADRLVVRGTREHNLQDVSLDLPRDELIVFTGLSGSGKSSLAFDTIYAEGQRRYVESLSAYARQFLGQMDKPDVDFIEGLSPAISIDQKSSSRNPRSTVGTVTEVYDYLRLLYARIGKPHCPTCGRPVVRQSPQQIVDRILAMDEGTRFMVLAPVVRGRKGEYGALLDDLAKQGFARARIDGDTVELADREQLDLARYEQHTIEVVVDRLVRRHPAAPHRVVGDGPLPGRRGG